MAKRWAVTIHTIKKSGNTYTADLYELRTNLVSGKLTLRMNDTSTLKFSVGFNRFRDISPVKSLVEVRFGEGTSWDTKFFGTITKRSRNIVEGIESYEAVGVLGSYRFLPNYDGYTDSSSLTDILDTEQKRFRGEWSSSDAKYTPSAWELLYQGQSWVPQNYGLLVDTQWFFANAKMSCNLERIQKSSKNAYEFLKAITKDGAYINETQYENGKWFEKGALAEFRPIISGDRNDQEADYRYNLLTVTVEDSPSCSRVEAVNKGSKQVVTSGAYPNPFYSARIMASDKSDGTTYTSAELQKIASNELLRGTRISEATCFDRHVIDDTIPWFDLSKYVYVRYAVGNTFALEEMQISEISYDLCDSTKDRVKLGAIQKALTDSMNAETNSLETSGGTMTGGITFNENGNNGEIDTTEISIRDRYAITCNLLDSALIEQGGILTDSGLDYPTPNALRSPFIKVSPSTTYTYSNSLTAAGASVRYYAADKSFIGTSAGGIGVFNTPNNCYYVRCEIWYGSAVYPSSLSWAQLEKGSSASSPLPYTMDAVEVAGTLRNLIPFIASGIHFSKPIKTLSSASVSVTISDLTDTDGWFAVIGDSNGAVTCKFFDFHASNLGDGGWILPNSRDITVSISGNTLTISGYAWSTLHIISSNFVVL